MISCISQFLFWSLQDEEEEREDSFAEISSAVLVNENIEAHTVFHNVTLLVEVE